MMTGCVIFLCVQRTGVEVMTRCIVTNSSLQLLQLFEQNLTKSDKIISHGNY